MRLLLHGYCRQASMNLSSHYGVEDECGIPFSCHSRPGELWSVVSQQRTVSEMSMLCRLHATTSFFRSMKV